MKNPEEEDIRGGLMKMKTAGFSCVDESMSDTVKTMVETKAAEVSAFSDEGVAMRALGPMKSFAEELAIEEKQKRKEEALKRKGTDQTDDNDGKDDKESVVTDDSKGPKNKRIKIWIERDDKVAEAIRAWDT